MQELSRFGEMPGKELQRADSRLHALFYYLYCIGLGEKVCFIQNHGRNVPGRKRVAVGHDSMEPLACLHGKTAHGFAESLGAEPMVMLQGLLNNKEYGRQVMVIANALKEQ